MRVLELASSLSLEPSIFASSYILFSRVCILEDEDNELSRLKTLYDELWSDAKTMIKDMRNSISIYLYSGLVTLLVSIFGITSAVVYFSVILSGSANFMTWLLAIVETIAAILTIAFGAKLILWYRRLKKRYSRLVKMEKDIRD
jgi:hypothetical protein